MSVGALSWADIQAWALVRGVEFADWEVEAIRSMDRIRVEWANTPEDKRVKKATPKKLAEGLRTMIGPKKPKVKPIKPKGAT
jgi:hypothetical protein